MEISIEHSEFWKRRLNVMESFENLESVRKDIKVRSKGIENILYLPWVGCLYLYFIFKGKRGEDLKETIGNNCCQTYQGAENTKRGDLRC